MKDDLHNDEESKSTTTTSQLLQPTPTTSLRLRSSLVFPTPLRTLSLPPIKDVSHGLVFPNGNTTAAAAPLPSSLCYTSLRDLISSASSSAALSSPASATQAMSSCYQIPIRNRLVKQAAWAYLQPMSSSSFVSSSRSQLFFTRLWDWVSSWRPLDCLKEHVEGRFLPAMQKILTRIRLVVGWLIAR